MDEMKTELTEQEADLYDRQIRLWGLESQKKLRAADVLLIGVRTLGTEIAKNVLLAGIKSMTFLDDGNVEEMDILTNFLLSRESFKKNRAEAVMERAKQMNPMVQITADSSRVEDKDELFYKKFTIIVATCLPTEQLITINQICRKHGVSFICGDNFGLFGFSFSDLQIHEYCEDVKQLAPMSRKRKISGNIAEGAHQTVRVFKSSTYVPLQDALGVDWTIEEQKKINQLPSWYFLVRVLLKFRDVYKRNPQAITKDSDIKQLQEIRNKLFSTLGINFDKLSDAIFEIIFGEIVPVSAILGGVIAQEVIKAVSHNEAPINNMFFFDPNDLSGKIECIGN